MKTRGPVARLKTASGPMVEAGVPARCPLSLGDRLTHPTDEQMRHHRLGIRCGEADDVVDAVLRNYAQLPPDIQTRLPLKQVWMLSNPDD